MMVCVDTHTAVPKTAIQAHEGGWLDCISDRPVRNFGHEVISHDGLHALIWPDVRQGNMQDVADRVLRVASGAKLLPVRYGHRVLSSSRLLNTLASHASILAAQLKDIGNCLQVSIVAPCVLPTTVEDTLDLRAKHDRLRQQRAHMAHALKKADPFLRAVQSIRKRQIGPVMCGTDKVAVHLLIERARFAEIRQHWQSAEKSAGVCACIGPLPPYAFACG